MIGVVVALGVLIVVLGALAAIWPGSMPAWGNWWKTPSRIYLAGVLRLALGTTLWVVAPQTDYVVALRVLGGATIVGGVVLFVAGPARIVAMIDWWLDFSASVHRIWGLAAVLVGILLIAAVW